MSNTQLDKNYGNDWAKSKSRDLVRGMIQRNLGYKKPQDLKVLCFPGNEAAEVREVYDALGIPRANIVGIERDREVADKIRAQNLGIQVVNQTLEDYVASQATLDFDVMSLDYTGPLTATNIHLLRDIGRKQRSLNWIMHQANQARREDDGKKFYTFADHSLGLDKQLRKEGSLFGHEAQEHLGEYFRNLKSKFEEREIGDLRDQTYAFLIRNSLLGASAEQMKKAAKFVIDWFYLENIPEYIWESPLHRPVAERFLRDGVGHNLVSDGLPHDIHPIIEQAIYDVFREQTTFKAKDVVAYSYISESGTPMIGTSIFLTHPRHEIQAARDLLLKMGFPEKMEVSDRSAFSRAFKDYANAARKFFRDVDLRALERAEREPVFLGSSARPVLTKQRAIEEFRNGAGVDDVKSKYRGVKDKPLAQWKAHVTRGTYNSAPSSDEVIVEDAEDADAEKITREQAIDFLANEIPVNEIFDAYPTSFSKGQLRAFKAWITMRSQKE